MNPKYSILNQKEAEIIGLRTSPFYIYDEAGIIRNAKKVMAAFSWNERFRLYFDLKTNPNPDIVNILVKLGCGCDCSSDLELTIAESLNAQIMFSSNVITSANEYIHARKAKAIINLDDISHIQFLLQEHEGIPDTICCKYNPGGDFEVSKNCMGTPGDAKYGMTREQIFEAFKLLKKLGVRKFGLHAFFASNTLTNKYYPKLLRELFELAVELKKKLHVNIEFINLSGGIGVAYESEDEPNDIWAISKGVLKVYNEIFAPEAMEPAIYTEMGCYMIAPFGQLVTKVLHWERTYKEYVICDACAANLMWPAMYGAYHEIIPLGKEHLPKEHRYDITGSLCENNDKSAIDRMLPEIEVGDILVICDAGAHGSSRGCNYHYAEYLKKQDGSYQIIKREETPEDYFSTFRIDPKTRKPRW